MCLRLFVITLISTILHTDQKTADLHIIKLFIFSLT